MAILYVGSYTQMGPAPTGSPGITVLKTDPQTGRTEVLQEVSGIPNPSFLAVKGSFLYACGEVGEKTLAAAFRREADGRLTLLNTAQAQGASACHVSVAPKPPTLLVTNYMSGSVAAFALREDGSIGEVTDVIRHTGHGPDPHRQEGPHTHSSTVFPDSSAAVADLGTDTVTFYELDQQGKLLQKGAALRVPPGEGPRHIAVSKDGKHFYLVTEMANRLIHFKKTETGWEAVESLPILPEGAEPGPRILAADVHFSPDEKFLYASNRGYDLLAAYRVEENGEPVLSGRYAAGGKGPRNFCVSPDGRWIVTADQDSGELAFLPRDRESGSLGEAAQRVKIPAAVCVLWTEERED